MSIALVVDVNEYTVKYPEGDVRLSSSSLTEHGDIIKIHLWPKKSVNILCK